MKIAYVTLQGRGRTDELITSVAERLTAKGLRLAGTVQSNHDRPDSFIGQNFAYRPYFTQAVAGGSGRFFALGTTSGGGGNDQLVSIEAIVGSQHADTLIGGAGGDNLDGASGDDSLDGGAGNDTLSGGVGSNTIKGGEGTDTATYQGALSAVTVSLALTNAQATGQSTDVLEAIENLTGSAFADQLTGDTIANVLDGAAGNDSLAGDDGDDHDPRNDPAKRSCRWHAAQPSSTPDGIAEAILSVLHAKEVATRADFTDCFVRQRGFINNNRL